MADDLERSRFRRAVRLSRLGARVALKQGQRLLSRDEGAVHRELAEAMVGELGKLKGLPMKVGQILSYMDGVVPDEYAADYQAILGQLRTTSAPVASAAWREVFHDELDASPESIFDSFDETPIATASIGQVHRAVYRGDSVCVKIQHPGIAEATVADFENVTALVGVMRRIMPNVDTEQMITDFRERLTEECDYRREADYQRRFAAIYARDRELMVPGVIDAVSTRRVLTTRFVSGVSLEAFMADATTEERDRAGRALFRFAFGTLLEHGLFHADPHPGNLLFRAEGTDRLGVLDYGCVQPVDEDARRDIGVLLRAAMEGRDLARPSRAALGIAEMDEVSEAATVKIVREVLAPILLPQPYRFTREFAKDISRSVMEAKKTLSTRFLTRRGRFVVNREGVMFIVRNLFGLASIWGTLAAEGDFRALTRELLGDADRVSAPPP